MPLFGDFGVQLTQGSGGRVSWVGKVPFNFFKIGSFNVDFTTDLEWLGVRDGFGKGEYGIDVVGDDFTYGAIATGGAHVKLAIGVDDAHCTAINFGFHTHGKGCLVGVFGNTL